MTASEVTPIWAGLCIATGLTCYALGYVRAKMRK